MDDATQALDRIGGSMSDLIRTTLLRITEEGGLSFDAPVPNRASRKAMRELNEGRGRTYDDVDALLNDVQCKVSASPHPAPAGIGINRSQGSRALHARDAKTQGSKMS